MKIARYVLALLITMAMSSVAIAQDSKPVDNEEFGVTITPPAKWEVTQGNEKAVANFKHRGSQSQIEVVGTKLMASDVADVFFDTFHKTLTESNFEKVKQEEVTIGSLKGLETTYKFAHSGVTLEVVIFQFLRESTAWLVVGYMQDVEKEKYIDDFKAVVQNITFKES